MHLVTDIQLINGIMGGVILGISTTGFIFFTGRTSGLSGIMEGMIVSPVDTQKRWASSYVIGLVSSGAILSAFFPNSLPCQSSVNITAVGVVCSGLLVGFGTRMANGCTSGHGVCGLSRMSPRSLAAVVTFMSTGAVGSYLSRETVLSKYLIASVPLPQLIPQSYACVATISAILLSTYYKDIFGSLRGGKKSTTTVNTLSEHLVSFLSALVFGLGLGISGMCSSDRVVNFLNFSGSAGWDPSLMGVMGGAVLFNLLRNAVVRNVPAIDKPPMLSKDKKTMSEIIKFGLVDSNLKIDIKLLLGSALFGLGWGVSGICPGPGVVALGGGCAVGMWSVPAMLTGMKFFLDSQF